MGDDAATPARAIPRITVGPRPVPFRVYLVADPAAMGIEETELRDRVVRAASKACAAAAVYWRAPTTEGVSSLPAELRPFHTPLFVKESDLDAWPRLRGAGGASGAHLKSDSRTRASALRARFAAPAWIARAVHSEEEARAAREDGADFAVFGHVFETASKPELPGRGLDALAKACAAASPIPVFAIGGVTPARVKECLAAGAWGVAVARGFSDVEEYLGQTG